ncbi:MAG: alpha/beta hydrolase [Planctomycetota bacterium]|jgi:esterase/lipase superfamily enzyme
MVTPAGGLKVQGRLICPPSVLLFVLLLLTGCACGGRELMPTPTIYTISESDPFASVPGELRGNVVDVLYVTDRMPVLEEGKPLAYDHRRSRSVAFGSCLVEIDGDLSWEELVRQSLLKKRTARLDLEIAGMSETGRFPATPLPSAKDNAVMPAPAALAEQEKVKEDFQAEVARRLALTPRKEAFVFVHGYHNTLEDAAFVMAELWHFLGREGVPIIYSWPAGRKGLLRGYNYDRESGEFTIYHFKQFLRALAATPGLKSISIVAHSRGTDVAASGFRELYIEARASGEKGIAALKVKNLLLIASDLDVQVAGQRFGAEGMVAGTGRLTLYVSENDKAIGISSWLFDSVRRLGQLRAKDIPKERLENLGRVKQLQVVDVRSPRRGLGHSYFRLDPSASSDLVLLLRYHRDPGAENGRPLRNEVGNYWILDKGYPETAED